VGPRQLVGQPVRVQFYDCNGAVSLSSQCLTTPIPPETGAIQISLPPGVAALTQANFPAIASAGDGNGGATPAALYVVATNGDIDALTINPNPATDEDLLEGTLTQVGTAPSGTTIAQIS
jgi:hypothetical protein